MELRSSRISSFAFSQAARGMRDVAGAVLRFPGEALAHRMELAEIGEMLLDQIALAGPHRALDELHDGRRHAVGDVAEDHAEGRPSTCPCPCRYGR